MHIETDGSEKVFLKCLLARSHSKRVVIIFLDLIADPALRFGECRLASEFSFDSCKAN